MTEPMDPEAVRNLVGRYCEAVMRADSTLFGDCWTADAEWLMPGAEPIRGRDAILARFERSRAGFRLCVQEILNGVVNGTAARWQVRELQWRADGTASELIGIYNDDVGVDDDGVCRYRRRRFELLYRGPTDLPGKVYKR